MDGEQQVSTRHAIDTYEIVILNLNPLKPSFINIANCLGTQTVKSRDFFFKSGKRLNQTCGIALWYFPMPMSQPCY
jgi:hypothetical protein